MPLIQSLEQFSIESMWNDAQQLASEINSLHLLNQSDAEPTTLSQDSLTQVSLHLGSLTFIQVLTAAQSKCFGVVGNAR